METIVHSSTNWAIDGEFVRNQLTYVKKHSDTFATIYSSKSITVFLRQTLCYKFVSDDRGYGPICYLFSALEPT